MLKKIEYRYSTYRNIQSQTESTHIYTFIFIATLFTIFKQPKRPSPEKAANVL